jgi:thioester reductase-like protein
VLSRTIVDIIVERSIADAHGSAYVFLSDGAEQLTLTFGDLHARVMGNAARIAEVAAKGDRAVILCPPGPEFVVAYYACLAAGVVAVPAFLHDPTRVRRGLERLTGILDDCSPTLLVTTEDLGEAVEEAHDAAPALRSCSRIVVELSARPVPGWQGPAVDADDIAMLQYTSGSTAAPKGVVLTHGNLVANVAAVGTTFEASSDSVVVSWLPTFHDMGLISGVLLPAYYGCVGVLMPPADFIRKPVRWLEAISTYRGTIAGGPNFAYELCRRHVDDEARATLDLSTWDVAFCGAEPVRADTMDGFGTELADTGFATSALLPVYGLAEATLIVSGGPRRSGPRAVEVDRDALGTGVVRTPGTTSGQVQRLVDVGVAAPTAEVRIVDPVTGEECADGVVGEVWVAGPSVAQGYWRNPTATDEVFGWSVAGSDASFLRTGDLGTLLDGHLHVTGRRKDVLILGGRNVYPQDLELTAERSSPVMRPGGSAVFTEEEDSDRVVLVAEVDDRSTPEDLATVVKRVRRDIAEHYEVPLSRVVLIKARSLPKTTSGKVQRRGCRRRLAAGELPTVLDWSVGDDEPGQSPQGSGFSSLQSQIADLCEEVMGVRPATQDEHLSLLGGGSLSVIRLINLVNKRFGLVVAAADAFRSLTVAGLAETVESARRGQQPASRPEQDRDIQDDAVLDPRITLPTDKTLASAGNPREVLLTGVTGFVGAFLLHELLVRTRARVHCLVRARSAADARERVVATLRGYGLPTDDLGRVTAVVGDLAQPQFGLPGEQFTELASRVDTIVHSAASVSAVQGYETLHQSNVLGTQEVIRFATCERLKRVHHISTLATLRGLQDWHSSVIPEQPTEVAPDGTHALSGYPRSKWAAEQLVHAAGALGVPVSIYRLARVSGDSERGFWADGDFWRRVIAGSIRARALPDAGWVDIWTPVDHVARAVVQIALRPRSAGRIFHVADTRSLQLADVRDWLAKCGYPIPQVTWQEWTEAIERDADNPMALFLPHLSAQPGEDSEAAAQMASDLLPTGSKFLVDTSNMEAALAGTGIACPPAGPELLARYLDRMVVDGLIPLAERNVAALA